MGNYRLYWELGGNNTAQVCKEVAYYSKEFNPNGILSVGPYYNKPSQEGIYQHFKAVSASTDTPIIVYNVPGRTSANMAASTTLRLAHDFANIVAIKEASGNFDQGMEIVNEKPEGFQVLSGEDLYTLPFIAMGYDGVISVIGNALPFTFSEMVRAALANQMDDARSLHYSMTKHIELCFAEGNPAGVKVMLNLLGFM